MTIDPIPEQLARHARGLPSAGDFPHIEIDLGLSLNEYQSAAIKTALPSARSITYMSLGLVGEAGEAIDKMGTEVLLFGLAARSGEIANKAKKLIRDGDTPEARAKIAAELGDALWYVAGLATELGVSLGDLAQENLDKLNKRVAEGKLGGSGDNR